MPQRGKSGGNHEKFFQDKKPTGTPSASNGDASESKKGGGMPRKVERLYHDRRILA